MTFINSYLIKKNVICRYTSVSVSAIGRRYPKIWTKKLYKDHSSEFFFLEIKIEIWIIYRYENIFLTLYFIMSYVIIELSSIHLKKDKISIFYLIYDILSHN